MGFGGGSKSKADKTEQQRQAQITQGTKQVNDVFAPFNDDFYAKRASDYDAWAMPQVEDQFSDAKKQLLFALARQYGSTNTSTAAERQAKLAKDYGMAKTQQTEQGLSVANQARGEMENARSQVLAQLSASADPAAANTSALNQATIAHNVDPYTPLGNLFANVTEGFAAANYPYGILGNTTPYGAKSSGSLGKTYTVNTGS